MKQKQTRKRNKSSGRRTAVMIIKMSAACGLSWWLANLTGSKHPYLAPLSVILCMQSTVMQSMKYSIHRSIGTLIGVAFTAVVTSVVPLNAWTIGILIFAGSWIANGLKCSDIVIRQVALTILLVFVFEHQGGNYIWDRLKDTGIGIAVALAAHLFVFPPNFEKSVQQSLQQLSGELTKLFAATADWVRSGCRPEAGQQLQREFPRITKEVQQNHKLLQDSLKSLRFYPFSTHSRRTLQKSERQLVQLERSYRYLEDLISTMTDWYASGTMKETDRQLWAEQISAIESCLFQIADTPASSGAQRQYPHIQDSAAGRKVPPLQVVLPQELQPYQYTASLYQETAGFIQELKQ